MIEFRAFNPQEDLGALLELENLCFDDDRWSEKQLLSHTQSPYAINLICLEGDVLCGFVLAHTLFDDAELYQIAVAEVYRGKRLGRDLLVALTDKLREKQVSRLMLEVRSSNSTAIHLYESYGFVLEGQRKGYYESHGQKEDALLYSYFISI